MKSKIATVVALMLAYCGLLPARAQHRDLKSGKKQLHSIALMPIQVELNRMSMKGVEPMMAEAQQAELPLKLEIQAVLRDLGYELDMDFLSTEGVVGDAEQRYAVDNLQKKFDAEMQVMRRKSKDVRKGRFSLGDEVARLAVREKTDALLFARVRGKVLTENKRAFGAFVAGTTNDTVMMDFGLVDARTGLVLYFAKAKATADILSQPEEIGACIAQAFIDLPQSLAQNSGSTSAAETSLSGPSSLSSGQFTGDMTSDSWVETRRLPLSHRVLKGTLVKQVPPEYPGIASMNHIEGDVAMRIVIDTSGQVSEVKVLSGPPPLVPAATSAIKQWRYRPFVIKGKPFEVETRVVMTFGMGN